MQCSVSSREQCAAISSTRKKVGRNLARLFESWELQKEANLIEFAKRFAMNASLQNSISIQPRTSPGKLAHPPTPDAPSGNDQTLATLFVIVPSNDSGMHMPGSFTSDACTGFA